ncbi:M4 family metallopeptidase [Streptomyces sp. NPDC001380]|uniref:M4 family metallopeptidase n=1 Tax=Streptomyces sp. NPDC001380 TaxID=3364566 RepID=UPI003699EAA5
MSRPVPARVATAALAAATALLAAGVPLTAHAATASAAGGAAKTRALPLGKAQRAELLTEAGQDSGRVAAALGLGAREKLVAKDVMVDSDGTRHVRYDRTFAGLPVLGGDLVVHERADGTPKAVDRASTAALAVRSTTPGIARAQAGKASLAAARGAKASGVAPRLVVWAAKGTPKLAWDTVVESVEKDGTPSRLHVVTDAKSGTVLGKFEDIKTGTGTGVYVGQVNLTTTLSGSTYQLKDGSRGGQYTTDLNGGTSGSGTLFTDADDVWGNGSASNRQSAAVDAQYGTAATWDFYKNTFGRTGIKNNGVGAYNRVHYGSSYVNAFWDDTCFCMTYGDGSGNTHPLTALDVAGHEMSHGVTSATANLTYSGESGGLNEATSDIFGTGVEWYANLPADPPDYLIGEEIDINGNGTPLRYMDKPSKDGSSKDSYYSGIGSIDVHYSSGPANHFFYLLSEGSGAKVINGVSYNSPTVNGITVTGITRAKALAVWYRALTTYFTSSTNYAGARTGTLSAAADLYGSGSAEYNAVATAWAAVGVGSVPSGGVTVTNPGNQSTATGTPVSLTVRATGGTGSYTWSATGLPAGLSINSSTGVISGTPTTAGTSNVTVTAKDSANASGSTSFTWTVSTGGGGGCTAQQLLGNAGFETGSAAPWTASSGVVDNSTGEAAHSGSWKAWMNGYGSTHTDTLSQTVSVPAGCKATLTFWLHIDTAETTTTSAYDKLSVQANSTTLASFSNLNKNTGYVQKSYDLSSFAGQSVTLKFTGTEDSSLQTSFVVDDTALTTG